jgi:signal transduction histidine kinase
MSQVFINLISNALKYTPKYGKVQVLCKEEKNHIVIKIIDNGEGISAEDLPHIFERLYRADKSRNRQTGGSGIGLSIVKSIVLAHNGQIDVESTVNKGTTILIRLPKD